MGFYEPLKKLTSRIQVNDKIENIIVNYIASGTPSDSFTNELENEVKKARDHIQ